MAELLDELTDSLPGEKKAKSLNRITTARSESSTRTISDSISRRSVAVNFRYVRNGSRPAAGSTSGVPTMAGTPLWGARRLDTGMPSRTRLTLSKTPQVVGKRRGHGIGDLIVLVGVGGRERQH